MIGSQPLLSGPLRRAWLGRLVVDELCGVLLGIGTRGWSELVPQQMRNLLAR